MTTYYIDADNGSDANNGLGPDSGAVTDKPWLTLHQFTENARSAGDIAILRRGTTGQYDDGGDLTFLSDGDLGNPIIIEADFFGSSANGLHGSDDWNGGEQFADSAQTFTMVFGSKTHTASATITGISVGDWIFNTTDGDAPRLFSYEVAAVSGTTLTLHLPWKGSTGATKTLRVMPAAPVWGTLTDAFKIDPNADHFWKLQGLESTGADTFGVLEIDSSKGTEVLDCIFKPNTGTTGIEDNGDTSPYLSKCRFEAASAGSGDGYGVVSVITRVVPTIENCLFEDFARGIACGHFNGELIEVEFLNCTDDFSFVSTSSANGNSQVKMRNCIFGATPVQFVENTPGNIVLIEDFDGTLNSTRQYHGLSDAEGDIVLQSDTGTVRSGGSNISAKVLPSTNMVEGSFFSKLELFEMSFYKTTSSKTYEVYFKSNATANWTANPTAAELFIELEAWGHASNNFREITKSTGTLNFTGVTTWNSLSVTVAPAQAGVVYLRGWYMKPKESAKTNEFFIDLKPVVT